MSSLSLPALSPTEIYVIGDVSIHERAIIAPGTILQAVAGSHILIEEGVCIGMGCVIAASHGSITLARGAILGAGVLLAGTVTVGKNACIGSASTVWNTSVDAMAIVAPGSLLGDASRQVPIVPEVMPDPEVKNVTVESSADSDPWDEPAANGKVPTPPKTPVVGQVYINQLLYTLFPGRQPPGGLG